MKKGLIIAGVVVVAIGLFVVGQKYTGKSRPGGNAPSGMIALPPPPPLPPPPGLGAPRAGTDAGEKAPKAKVRPLMAMMPPPMPMMMSPPGAASPSAEPVDAKKLEIAKKVVKIFDQKNSVRSTLKGGAMSMMMTLNQENQGKADAIQKIFDATLDKAIADRGDETTKDLAAFYAQTFSVAELEQLKSFYESSAGQKMIKSMDDISRRSSSAAQTAAFTVAPEVNDNFIKELKKNDIKIPKAWEDAE